MVACAELSAAAAAVKEGRFGSRTVAVIALLADYQAPRVFQFFQFMIGLLCVGAMGFTFAQMHRTRELVAILAAGVPLRCDEADDFSTFRIGLFGLDKLANTDRTVDALERALDTIARG